MKATFVQVHKQLPHDSHIETGTVISADPLVISLDLEKDLQLEFNAGDFIMNDMLVLAENDRVALSRMQNEHLYCVMFRIRGTLGTAVVGRAAAAQPVARLGDTVAVSLGTGLGTITSGSGKLKSE